MAEIDPSVVARLAEPFSWHSPAPHWDEGEPCAHRAQTCLLFLVVHGVITDAERSKAIARLKKLIAKEAEHAR